MKLRNYLLLITVFLMVFGSCNQPKKKSNSEISTSTREITYETLETILKNAEKLSGKTVNLTGVVDHICKHGNNRFKILSSDGSEEIKVELGDNFKMVSPEIEGKTVKVTGKLIPAKMDAQMVKAWENKTRKNHKGEENTTHFKEEISNIQAIGRQIESGEIPYYVTYSVQAISYEAE